MQNKELRSIFAWMIERLLSPLLSSALGQFPAVALLGLRQVGKTTLAIELGEKLDAYTSTLNRIKT